MQKTLFLSILKENEEAEVSIISMKCRLLSQHKPCIGSSHPRLFHYETSNNDHGH